MRVFTLFFLLSLPAFGASKYVRAGASGSNDGSSWADAWQTLTNIVWARGDTVFIAGGNYTNTLSIECAESESSIVTLKKANATDNSLDAGWDAAYASQQAFINGTVSIANSYVVIDGVTGADRSGYGIKIYQAAAGGGNAIMNMTSGKSFFTLSRVEMEGPGWGYVNGVSAFKINTLGSISKGIRISNVWAKQFTQNAFVFSNVAGESFEDYGLLYENVIVDDIGFNTSEAHGQAIQGGSGAAGSVQAFWTVRNSIFRNCLGTADIAFLGYSTNSDVLIYNNVFMNTNHSVTLDGVWTNYTPNLDAAAPGVIYTSSTLASSARIRVLNNTFHKICRNTVYFGDSVTNGNQVANNLFLDGRFPIVHQGVVGATNDYYLCEPIISSGIYGTPYGEAGQQTETAIPVVSLANGDFRLVEGANAIGTGTDLSSYFTTDITGATRTAPWDIGAYKYTSGAPIISGRQARAATVNVWTLTVQ